MEHTYTHRKNAWSAREHRLLFFETPKADPGVNESADNENINVEALVQKVREISTKLEEQAGIRGPDNRTEEAKLQGRMREISHNFNTKSAKLIATMETHRDLRAKAAGILGKLLVYTEKQMLDAQNESERIAVDRENDAEDIVDAREEELTKQRQLYEEDKTTASKSTNIDDRAVEYAEDQARATIEQIKALAESIDRLLLLTSDKEKQVKLTERQEKLLLDEITILGELADFQQMRRNALKDLAEDENAPKTAVDERLQAAREQLARAANARIEAKAAALKQGISRNTVRALTRKADALFDSMAEVHHEKTQLASDAHGAGEISLDAFVKVLEEEIQFLDTYDRNDAIGFSLGKLVIAKAEQLVHKEVDVDKKKAAREEARTFINSKYGRAYIRDEKRAKLLQTISDAEKTEVEAAVTEKQEKADSHRVEQTVAAQELLIEDPIVDLHAFIEKAGTVLADDNLGQYLNKDEYKEITELAKSLAEKVVTQIETDITSLDHKVEELYDAATKGKTVPEKFEGTLGEVTRVSNNVELYNGSPLAQLKKVDPEKMKSRASYRSCFASIVTDYVRDAAVTAKDAAKDAATFRKAFEVVENAEKVIEANRENLSDLLGGASFDSVFTVRTELEEKLASAISRTSSATERAALHAVQLEQQKAGDPYRRIRLSLLIESEKEKAVKEAEGAAIGNRMGDLRNADIIVADREVLTPLRSWLSGLERASPTDPKNNVGTEMKAGTTYWDRGRCYRTAPTYSPSIRTQVQDYLRLQLQKTNQMQERHQKDSLTQEVVDVTRQLRSEQMRWMTPEQNLREAQVEWVGERSAINRVLIGAEDIDSVDGLNALIVIIEELQASLNQNPFSVRNKLAATDFIPDNTVGKDALIKEVEQKYTKLQTTLNHTKEVLKEYDALSNAQNKPPVPAVPNNEPDSIVPDFPPPQPDEGNNGSTIK